VHSMVRIGFIGAGRMGLPMCVNLVRAGYQVTAGDVRAEQESAVTGCGARWEGTPSALAAESDLLITMLPGAGAVHDVMAGPGGALAALPPSAVWIDMTSNSPAAGRALAAAAGARGIGVLDAPVGGGVEAAQTGTLHLFVGGDIALLERHRALLEVLADPRHISHVGAHGAGYLVKLLVNLLWFGQAVATAEALLLGRRAGLDLDALRRALAGSAASSALIRHDLDALLDGDYLASFELDRCCEELTSVIGLAREYETPCELSAVVERTYQHALSRYGPVGGELLAVALLEEQAGVRLRHQSA
jgi:3-hydroxyisobutyrate dehydrogenase